MYIYTHINKFSINPMGSVYTCMCIYIYIYPVAQRKLEEAIIADPAVKVSGLETSRTTGNR